MGEKFFSNTYNIVHGLFTGTSIWNHSVWTIVILSSIRKVFWDIAFTGYIAHLFLDFLKFFHFFFYSFFSFSNRAREKTCDYILRRSHACFESGCCRDFDLSHGLQASVSSTKPTSKVEGLITPSDPLRRSKSYTLQPPILTLSLRLRIVRWLTVDFLGRYRILILVLWELLTPVASLRTLGKHRFDLRAFDWVTQRPLLSITGELKCTGPKFILY